LNNDFQQAKSMTAPLAGTSIYHSLGYSAILYLQAVMTFDAGDIEAAVGATKRCLDLCQSHRRQTSFTSSLTSSFNKAMQRTSSFATGSNPQRDGNGKHDKEYNNLTDLEIHSELVYAECLLLRSILTFIQDENLVSFIKGGLKIRACYQSYKECLRIYRHRDWNVSTSVDEAPQDDGGSSPNVDRNAQLKMHFDSGVKMGMGAFNVIISLLPAKVMKLLEIAGFSGNKSWGLKQLEEGFMQLSSLRSPLCAIVLLTYHTLISYVIGTGDGDLDFAETILDKELAKYPNGAMFLFYAGRLQEMRGNLEQAVLKFEASIDSQSQWQQFHHICFWELMWCSCFQGDWLLGMKYAEKLSRESRWSPATYTYHKAAFLLMVEESSNSSTGCEHATALMKSVPTMTQRIAGKSLPIEKFAARKVKRYLAQRNRLVLPGYELMYVWNGFSVLGTNPSKLIPPVLKRIEATLEALSPATSSFVEDQSLCLLLKGNCLKHLKKYDEAMTMFMQVLANQRHLKDEMIYLLPYTTAEVGFLHLLQENYEQAREYLERAKSEYKGYSLESRLHFRLHAALHKIALVCDGITSPDVLSDTSSASVSPNVLTEAQFTFPNPSEEFDEGSAAYADDDDCFSDVAAAVAAATTEGITNANLAEERGSGTRDSGIAPGTPKSARLKPSPPSRSSTSSIRSACSDFSSEDEKLNEWHDCQ